MQNKETRVRIQKMLGVERSKEIQTINDKALKEIIARAG
jgi:hypothetical protein